MVLNWTKGTSGKEGHGKEIAKGKLLNADQARDSNASNSLPSILLVVEYMNEDLHCYLRVPKVPGSFISEHGHLANLRDIARLFEKLDGSYVEPVKIDSSSY